MKSSPRIFIGLRELSGYYHHLKKGFDALGIEAVFANLSGHPYRYGEDKNPWMINLINRLAQKIGTRFYRNWTMRILWVGFLQNILSAFLFVWALVRFDVFIFASNSTFFFFLDLPVLKLCRKKIIYVFHGSEARPVYLNGYVLMNEKTATILIGIILARIQKLIISIIERFADYIINIPPQAYFHSRPFISWWMIGVPHEVSERSIPSPATEKRQGSVRILHAPSKPEPKGTPLIRQVIKSLKGKGYAIDYVEITGRPNAEVLAELHRCDFIADEIYSDTPMAVFATEAAFAGKPAVVGSYYAMHIHSDLPAEDIPPSMFCHPDNLEEAMETMISNQTFREELGKKAFDFVMNNWSATNVAQHYLMLINGNFPQRWLHDPHNIRYLHGCGLPEERTKKIIDRFLKIGGRRSMCLSDKPVLEEMFVRFASGFEKP